MKKISEKFQLTLVLVTTIILLGGLFSYGIYSMRASSKAMQETLKISDSKNKVVYYDEVLTMSARLASFTGDLEWRDRYYKTVSLLDGEIKFLREVAPSSLAGESAVATEKANMSLIEDEEKSFEFVVKGEKKKAQDILFTDKYSKNKAVYSESMRQFGVAIENKIAKVVEGITKTQNKFIVSLVVITLFLLMIWLKLLNRIIFNNKLRAELKEIELKRNTQLAMVGELSLGLSHDIINPLSAVDGALSILESEVSDSELSDIINSAKKSNDFAINLCRNMNSFSREDDKLRRGYYSLNEIVDAAVLFSSKRVDYNSVVLKKNYILDTMVYCNLSGIKQVLANLFINAGDAIKDLDDKWISVESITIENAFYIKITDSGAGIPDEISNKIFDFQFTTKSKGKGSGIGLSMCKRIIEEMNGEIYIDKTSPNTTFVIKIACPQEEQD